MDWVFYSIDDNAMKAEPTGIQRKKQNNSLVSPTERETRLFKKLYPKGREGLLYA